MFKMNEVAFRTNEVTYPAMIAMAEKTVREITGTESELPAKDGEKREGVQYNGANSLTTVVGSDYIFYANACRLFTNIGKDDIEIFSFMDVVMENETAFEDWLKKGGGEKYRMYKAMVERGLKHFYDKPAVVKLLDEAIRFIQNANGAIEGLDLGDENKMAAFINGLEGLVDAKGNAATK